MMEGFESEGMIDEDRDASNLRKMEEDTKRRAIEKRNVSLRYNTKRRKVTPLIPTVIGPHFENELACPIISSLNHYRIEFFNGMLLSGTV